MKMYEIMMFTGGVYKFNELKEVVEDIGGFVLQEMVMQSETMMHLAFPVEEEPRIRAKAKELGGKLKELPLAGAEIMVVVPSLGKHHAVDPMCDVAEFLRRNGAITNMIGLARGVGKRIAQMTAREKAIIEECDAAVFVFGNFKECLTEKAARLCSGLEVPYLIVGGPPESESDLAESDLAESDLGLDLENYVGGVGRRAERMRRKSEIELLEKMVEALKEVLDEKKRELEEDPLAASPLFVKEMIEMNLPPKAGEELPIVIHLDGLRVKVGQEDEERVLEIEIGKRRLSEICEMKESLYSGHLLKVLPEAVTGSVF
ncbi:MAG TPA: methanogenesis marker 7 protein [Methanomicrobia archaeon]|nr:methanogenesis marker 7 protein [Methanomicrobia archaeon]